MSQLMDAVLALREGKVVLADLAGRRVIINALSQANSGAWIAKFSHRDWPQAQVAEVSAATDFIIHSEFGRLR